MSTAQVYSALTTMIHLHTTTLLELTLVLQDAPVIIPCPPHQLQVSNTNKQKEKKKHSLPDCYVP